MTEIIYNATCVDINNKLNSDAFQNWTACELVSALPSCKVSAGFIEYTHFLYCFPSGAAFPIFILCIWLILLLITLATSTDSFFSPCLIVITRILRMSQNLAGVTLLAFGNGAADIFAALSSINSADDGDAGMAFGSLLGTGLFVNCVTGGAVMMIQPFSCARRPLLKELIFYGIASLWILSILLKERIYLGETLGFFALYTVYVIVTVTGRVLYTRQVKPIDQQEIPPVEMSPVKEYIPSVTSGGDGDGDGGGAHGGNEDRKDQEAVESPREMTTSNLKRTFTGFSKHNNYLARWVMENKEQEESHMSSEFTSAAVPIVPFTPRKRTLTHIPATEPSALEEISRNRPASTMIRDLLISYNHQPLFPNGVITSNYSNESPASRQEMASVEDQKEVIQSAVIEGGESIVEKEKESENENENKKKYIYPGLWPDFVNQLIPIDLDEWHNMSKFSRTLEVVRAPFLLILRLTTPVVYEEHPIASWTKILNCLHCITTPMLWLLATQAGFYKLGSSDVPLFVVFAVICPCLSLLVWFTSAPDSTPKYHGVYAFVGFATSIVWIYTIANEIVNMLTSLGLQLNISQAILGLSVLSWANSVGDLMSNLVLAKNNYPRIAYSACVGGPFFSCMFGLGIPFTIKCIQHGGSYAVKASVVQYVLIGFVLLKILVQLTSFPIFFKFRLGKASGGILIAVYFLFFFFAFLSELYLQYL